MIQATTPLVRTAVPLDLKPAVDALARRTGTDSLAVLLTALLATLYRHTLREELLVATEDVALPFRLTPDRSFGDVLAELAAGIAAAPLGDRLAVHVTAEGLELHLEVRRTCDGYAADLSAEVPAGSFRTLLADATQRPYAAIGGLTLLDATEVAALTLRINATHDVYPDLRPVHALFEEVAAREPSLTAIVQGEDQITYGELNQRANLLAHRLVDQGIGVEQTVGVLTRRSIDLVVALLGIWKAGAAYVPLDARMPAGRISVIAADAGVSAIVTQEAFLDLLGGQAQPLVTVSGGATPEGPTVPVAMSNAAFIYYTSGSTGVPKGVVIDHRCAAGRLEWLARRYPLGPGDRLVHKTPLIFDVALWEIMGPLSAGATIAMADPEAEADVAHLGRLISADGTVFAHFVPSMLNAYLNFAPAADYHDLRWVQLSGEAMPAHLLDRFTRHFQAEFHSLYGQTETSEVAAWEGRSHPGGGHIPLGRQIGIYRLLVLDADLNPVPPDVPGELCVAGVGGLARGYRGQPGLTADRFVPHPFPIEPGERLYRTGDQASMDGSGVISFLGRLDDQTKIRGCRVETGEVEAVLAAHPAITQCAVVARPDDEGANQLVAYVVGGGVSVEELAAHAERRLPTYMLPAVYVTLDDLPIGSSGKLDRKRLPAPGAEDWAARTTAGQPLGPVETQLCAVWKEILGVDQVGTEDNFFAVGGNSLKALRMLNRVTESFGIEYSVRDFFAGPTITRMAACLEDSLAAMLAAMSDDEAARFLSVLKKESRS